MPTGISHSIKKARNVCTVHLLGEIDSTNSSQVAQWIRSAIDTKKIHTVQIDLLQLGFMDSIGIRCLVEAHLYARTSGKALTIINSSAFMSRILQVVGLTERFGLE